MKCKKLFVGIFFGLLLGSTNLVQSFDQFGRVINTIETQLDGVSQSLIRNNFKTLVKLLALLGAVKFIYDLTDGKHFDEASNDENLRKALQSFVENFGSLDDSKQAIKEVWYKVIRILRSITGHRPYKISIKEETITNADGFKSTTKQEGLIPGTKLCRLIETFLETTYPFIITSSTAIIGIRRLARVLETGNLIEGGATLPEIKKAK
jgi:hypothetical protein